MDSARLKQIEDIYHAACGIAETGRKAFVDDACGGDDDLRREVVSLLTFDKTPSGFFDAPPESLAAKMFAENKEALNLTNKTIGHYTVIELIGVGGMGEVYLAEDTKLDRKVALKILPREFAEDVSRMNRFVREAKSASTLNHPNIITIYEINEFGGTHFIATEFINGKTLNDYRKENPLDLGAILEIAIQVASALDEAHSEGLVHRDIKPENVMLRKDGIVKVLDFGLAKPSISAKVPSGSSENATKIRFQTQPGLIIGTPNYMSPEQARGKQLDHRTDIFSFGIVLYEMLSGESPFAGETVSDTIAAVLTLDPPRLLELPKGLEAIIHKALKKDKEKRYQTAKDLLHDLKEVKQDLEFQNKLKLPPRIIDLESGASRIFASEQRGVDGSSKARTYKNSVAVLAFKDMSAGEDNEYFCDGLAGELIDALSKVDDLMVAARSDAFSFKDKSTNIGEIGEKLGVKTVLEGSVRIADNRYRVSVQLINAEDGYQIWSERYEREMNDIFEVQNEIAFAILNVLNMSPIDDKNAATLNHGTANAEAYRAYLKGRFYWNKQTAESLKQAIEFYSQAIELDPNYTLAYAGRAECSSKKPKIGSLEAKTVIINPSTERRVETALNISSDQNTNLKRVSGEITSGNINNSTHDSLRSETVIITADEKAVSGISQPTGFLSQVRSNGVLLAILASALLAVGGFFGYRYVTANIQIRSVAVLPFANETGSTNNEYLSDGLSDSLINRLSQLPQLKVIARSSAFKYKGKEIDVGEIAKTLGVQAIVTGRVTQIGDDLQISVELINAVDNTRIWGDTYNRKAAAALHVPEEIAQAVSGQLQLNLSGAQERQMARHLTKNPLAYQYHLNGIFYRRKNGADNIRKAIDYQNQAIALDPNFTLAYIELSINYGNLIDIGAISPKEGLPQAKAAAEKALALDDKLADAIYNLARIRKYEFEWAKAEAGFRQAIEINPNLAGAHTIYAEFLSQVGRPDEALQQIKQSQELDPLRTGLVGNEGNIYYQARQYDEAIVKYQFHVKAAPENPFSHLWLANAYVQKGDYANALSSYNDSLKIEETASALICLGRLYVLTGKRNEANAILEKLRTTDKYVSPVELSILYAALGDQEKALASLQKAYTDRDTQLTALKTEPALDPLRGDPRFQDLMRRVGFE